MASIIQDKLAPRFELDPAAGQSPAVIRVRNLQTILNIGKDAWGRSGKSQPVLLSASVFLKKPFESASNEDAVTNSTIHYGILSKRILEASALFSPGQTIRGQYESRTLRKLTHWIYQSLTRPSDDGGDPILTESVLNLLELSIMLPKASLIGTGVSLTFASLFNIVDRSVISINLALHDLRIPTLIGVNSNERLAKQIVVANVEIDGYALLGDEYCELEQVVVKVRYYSVTFQSDELKVPRLSKSRPFKLLRRWPRMCAVESSNISSFHIISREKRILMRTQMFQM